ncbi:MAG: TolB protein [Blastocatellia bacterium]
MNLLRKLKQQLVQLKGRQIMFVILLLQATSFTCCDLNCNRESGCPYVLLAPGTYLVKYHDQSQNVISEQLTTDGRSCVQPGGSHCDEVISITKITPGGGGVNGKIVFQRGFDADGQIILLDPATGTETPLGAGKNPAFSPNGALIAFERNNQIFLMQANGTGQRMLASGQHPTWSPDGSYIAYVGQIDPETFLGNIFYMSSQGGTSFQLTNSGRDDTPAWGAGNKIAFIRIDSNSEIFVMDADGSNQKNITNKPGPADYAPAWSPDGAKIVFTSTRDSGQGEIYTMDASGGDIVRITNDSFGDEEPAYSPDGLKIVWSSGSRPAASSNKIFVMDANGGNQHQLTTTPVTAFDSAPDWGVQGAAALTSQTTIERRDSSGHTAHQAMPKARPLPKTNTVRAAHKN